MGSKLGGPPSTLRLQTISQIDGSRNNTTRIRNMRMEITVPSSSHLDTRMNGPSTPFSPEQHGSSALCTDPGGEDDSDNPPLRLRGSNMLTGAAPPCKSRGAARPREEAVAPPCAPTMPSRSCDGRIHMVGVALVNLTGIVPPPKNVGARLYRSTERFVSYIERLPVALSSAEKSC